MMKDFLAENNQCGQAILRLVARGNSVITELLRLIDFIPPVFKMESKEDISKYGELISDFAYFSNPEVFDFKVESNQTLQDRDEEFRENNLTILERFYYAFEGVHKYITDLNRFLEDLEEGIYVQHSLVSVLLNDDGKQLLCEALYLYGVMLMTVDNGIEGPVRERILVSYQRYSAGNAAIHSNIEDVCNLMRSTGFSLTPYKRPAGYPESFFRRIPVNSNFVLMLIDRLRSDDIYHQCAAYPVPDHRFAALSTQAAMLYVILYFAPETLNNEQAKMREIVDKHFPDNWVINVYMGYTVNLAEAWHPYRAAKSALDNSLDQGNVRLQAQKHAAKVPRMLKSVDVYLKEGVLNREFVLDNISKLMAVVRDCNVTIRWVMLHTAALTQGGEASKRCRQLREQVLADAKYDPEALFRLLLLTGLFEFNLKELFSQMLAEKEENWNAYRKECVERMAELSEVFSGAKALSRVEKNSKLQAWFENLGQQINDLEYTNSTAAGRKLDQIIQALREVLEFHQLDSNLQVKQFLEDTCRFLQQMMRVINLKDEVLEVLQIIADLSYAWRIIDSYTKIMQRGIKRDPTLVIKLRATFLKLVSALELPLVRIHQAKSPDFVSVSQYYSSELVSYMRKVLQIIPEMMFGKLAKIIQLQTSAISEVPTRLEKDRVKDFAHLEHRYDVAKLTRDISVFTEGMYMMKKTLVGVKQIDPKQLLEDGIRKELVQRVCRALHDGLTFNIRAKQSELLIKLTELGDVMDGFRRSFEYIQDYVNIYGLRIWQEEVSRIINYYVEQECNSFLRQKVADWESLYQSRTIPIPKFAPVPADPQAASFVGRLTNELLRVTDPRNTIFVEQLNTWYDARYKNELLNIKVFQKLEHAIDSFGLSGIDRLLSFMLVRDLQAIGKQFKLLVEKDKTFVEGVQTLQKSSEPLSALLGQPGRLYSQFASKFGRPIARFTEMLLKVGQLQLLRRQIANQLSMSCKFDSKFLAAALETLNESLMADIQAHYHDPQKPCPDDDNELLSHLSEYLEHAGMHDPISKIYITMESLPLLPIFLVALSIHINSKMTYSPMTGALIARRYSDGLDGAAYAIGVFSLLKQFHADAREDFLARYGQFVRSLVENIPNVKNTPFPADVVNGIAFLSTFCLYGKLPKHLLADYIPEFVLTEARAQATE